MNLRSLLFLVSMTLLNCTLSAFNVENIQGPTHEAFFTPVTSSLTNQAVAATPPDTLLERIPQQADSEAIWIPGYWDWDAERNDYLWISGVWRRPPPDHQWVNGYWKKFDEGWVRIKGFWAEDSEQNLAYLRTPPPDAIDEDVGEAPGKNYFWTNGYWSFDKGNSDFNWVRGAWVAFDQHWILVPAHYVWRESGYTLVNAYWDWDLSNRGTAYTSLYIPEANRSGFIYEPSIIVEPLIITQHYFTYYPDYSYFYCHNYHFYPDVWAGLNVTPSWWGWNSWWSYSWHDNWALWWWWGHPGYPAPGWMTPTLAQQIAPPSNKALSAFKDIAPPVIVTPKGVVSPNKLADAVQDKFPRNNRRPILPANTKVVSDIAEKLTTNPGKKTNDLRPSGKLGPMPVTMSKPKIVSTDAIPQMSEKRALPTMPGAPTVLRTKPETPGSAIKPAIPTTSLPKTVPNLAPSQIKAVPRDVYKAAPQSTPTSDRGSVQFTKPEHLDRTPYTQPSKVITTPQPSTFNKPSTPYVAPYSKPQLRSSSLSDEIYEVPQGSAAIIQQKQNEKQQKLKEDANVNPFNPRSMPERKTTPAHFPPRPEQNQPSAEFGKNRNEAFSPPRKTAESNGPVQYAPAFKRDIQIPERPMQMNMSNPRPAAPSLINGPSRAESRENRASRTISSPSSFNAPRQAPIHENASHMQGPGPSNEKINRGNQQLAVVNDENDDTIAASPSIDHRQKHIGSAARKNFYESSKATVVTPINTVQPTATVNVVPAASSNNAKLFRDRPVRVKQKQEQHHESNR